MNQYDKNLENKVEPKKVRVSAQIPLELHLAARHIYSMQGTSIAQRVEKLLRADLKKAMGREWFKSLPEEDVNMTKWLIELNAKKGKSVGEE